MLSNTHSQFNLSISEEGEPGADDVLFYSKSFRNPSFLNVTNEDLFLKNLLQQ
jgi:hypothetical protein